MRIEGGLDAQTIRIESGVGRAFHRGVIVAGVIRAQPTAVGVQRCRAGQRTGNETRFAARRTAAGAGELAGLSRAAIDLAVLNRQASAAPAIHAPKQGMAAGLATVLLAVN